MPSEKDDYIDFLHDRIEFLEEELQASEETVLELKQELDTKQKMFEAFGGGLRGRNREEFYRNVVDRLEKATRQAKRRGEKVDEAEKAIERMRHKIDNEYFDYDDEEKWWD